MNRIKDSGADGVALQVTKAVRAAGMVEQTDDGDITRRADVRVFAFDGVLLVIDLDHVSTGEIAELVAAAANDTKSIYRAADSRPQRAGNGFQVQLPPAKDAGFDVSDRAGTHFTPGVVVITKGDGPRAKAASRLGADLVSLRQAQIQ